MIKEILTQLNTYLANANSESSLLEVIVEYIIPIVSTVILVGSALAGVIKYYVEKNRDFNEKVLSGVYAPLFQYVVKQEFMRSLSPDVLTLKKYPILGLTKSQETIKNSQYTKQETEVMENSELLAVKRDLNFGLVPQDLLVLLNVYEMALELSNNVDDEEFYKIQFELRKNIIEGYLRYRKKLGLNSKTNILQYKNDIITFFGK